MDAQCSDDWGIAKGIWCHWQIVYFVSEDEYDRVKNLAAVPYTIECSEENLSFVQPYAPTNYYLFAKKDGNSPKVTRYSMFGKGSEHK